MSSKKISPQKTYERLLRQVPVQKALTQLPDLHDEAFEKVDCLACAACCKNYSPRFKTPDIKRIAKHLRLKESEYINQYLILDHEGDYVTPKQPCPFLGEDNYCSIYEVRPSDCRRFPYTDEDVLLKRRNITLKNATFCPAVTFVLDRLVEKFP